MKDFEFPVEGHFAVLGAGVEGRAVIAYLQKQGCRDIVVCDKDERVVPPDGVQGQLGDEYLANLDRFDVIFRSPGVPRDLASLQDAEAAGVHITSATKEFLRRCPCTVVGVTGSNGKTTTTSLIAEFLRSLYGGTLHEGGNDRRPLLEELDTIARDHVAVLEMSSFQLQDLRQSPNVAVVLNVTPNHLDVHPTFEDYVQAKSQIVRHQEPSDYAVLNWSFDTVRDFASLTPAQAVYCNHADEDQGAFLREGKLIVRHAGVEEVLLQPERLPWITNLDNLMAAALVGRLFGVPTERMRELILRFRPSAHRMELVRELDGVRYFDDSSSTTPESSMNALRSFAEGKVVLIAGGTDKRLEYDHLAQEIVRTRTRTVLIGSTRERIARAIEEAGRRHRHEAHSEVCGTLADAVRTARRLATPGDVVVLSPGCASFDMFKNAKDRGEQFQREVLALGTGKP